MLAETVAVTWAGAARVKATVAELPVPSAVGVSVAGVTVSPDTTAGVVEGAGVGAPPGGVTGAGVGAGGTITPMDPWAGRTFGPASICHLNGPLPARDESQVHSTLDERPRP